MTVVLTCEDHKALYTPDPPECRERPVNPCEPGQPRLLDEAGNTLECVVYPSRVEDLAQSGNTPDLAQNLLIVALVLILIGIVALTVRVRGH